MLQQTFSNTIPDLGHGNVLFESPLLKYERLPYVIASPHFVNPSEALSFNPKQLSKKGDNGDGGRTKDELKRGGSGEGDGGGGSTTSDDVVSLFT